MPGWINWVVGWVHIWLWAYTFLKVIDPVFVHLRLTCVYIKSLVVPISSRFVVGWSHILVSRGNQTKWCHKKNQPDTFSKDDHLLYRYSSMIAPDGKNKRVCCLYHPLYHLQCLYFYFVDNIFLFAWWHISHDCGSKLLSPWVESPVFLIWNLHIFIWCLL